MNHILHIDASGRGNPSVSRQLSNQIVQKISNDQSKVTTAMLVRACPSWMSR